MSHASDPSMIIPVAPGLLGISHGSAAGSQSGPLEGSNSSVAEPSQAIVSTPDVDLVAPPAAKRDRRSQSHEDGIITHPPAEAAETTF